MKNIFIICMLSCLFCGCDDNIPQPEKLNPPAPTNAPLRFQVLSLEKQYKDNVNANTLIVYRDNLTGTEYLSVDSYHGVAIIKLEKVKGE